MTKHGGQRSNAGRPKEYNEPLADIHVKVPESKRKEVKQHIAKLVKSYKVGWYIVNRQGYHVMDGSGVNDLAFCENKEDAKRFNTETKAQEWLNAVPVSLRLKLKIQYK